MSGRQYDDSNKATCNVCGADCWLSNERNFNGARCKNIMCNSHDVTYDMTATTDPKRDEFIKVTLENFNIDDVLAGDGPIDIKIKYTDRDYKEED